MRDEPVSPDHKYVLAYARDRDGVRLFGTPPNKQDYPYEDEKGKYRSTDLTVGMTREMRATQFYEIRNPRTGATQWPPENRVSRFQPSTMDKHIEQDNIVWPDDFSDRNMTPPRFKTRYNPESMNPVSTSKTDLESSTPHIWTALNEGPPHMGVPEWAEQYLPVS